LPTQKIDSGLLRDLAEDFLDKVAGEDEIPASVRSDLVTSLVRQWATYDGHAALFAGERLIFLSLGYTPLGRPRIVPKPAAINWLIGVIRGRKIDPEHLPDIVEQLNRGQSAEVTSEDGDHLRLWVNPKAESCGVELLSDGPPLTFTESDCPAIATRYLLYRFGAELGDDEIKALAASVAKQWKEHDGHASVFAGPREEIRLRITTPTDGPWKLDIQILPVKLDTQLPEYGVSSGEIPRVIAQFNLGRPIELRPEKGPPIGFGMTPRPTASRRRTLTRFHFPRPRFRLRRPARNAARSWPRHGPGRNRKPVRSAGTCCK